MSRPDAGFAADTNRVSLLTRDGGEQELPLLSKMEVAERIVAWMEQALAASPVGGD